MRNNKACEREIAGFPEDIRAGIVDAVLLLERGIKLSLPLSRPMPSIGAGVHELRFRDKAGIYRVVYWIRSHGVVRLIHAFKQKTGKTPQLNIDTAKARLRRMRHEEI